MKNPECGKPSNRKRHREKNAKTKFEVGKLK